MDASPDRAAVEAEEEYMSPDQSPGEPAAPGGGAAAEAAGTAQALPASPEEPLVDVAALAEEAEEDEEDVVNTVSRQLSRLSIPEAADAEGGADSGAASSTASAGLEEPPCSTTSPSKANFLPVRGQGWPLLVCRSVCCCSARGWMFGPQEGVGCFLLAVSHPRCLPARAARLPRSPRSPPRSFSSAWRSAPTAKRRARLRKASIRAARA